MLPPILSINASLASGVINAASRTTATAKKTNRMNRVEAKQNGRARTEPPRTGPAARVPAVMFTTSADYFRGPGIEFSGGLPENAARRGQLGMKNRQFYENQ
jgi:hypothetical protein